MNLDEFKRNIEKWGKENNLITTIEVRDYWTEIFIQEKEKSVSELIADGIHYHKAVDLKDAERQTLFKIVVKFANTLPSDRKDKEKKYYLKHRFIKSLSNETYLNGYLDYFWLGSNDGNMNEVQQFTEEEIEEIKMTYDTDLKDFEMVEVNE